MIRYLAALVCVISFSAPTLAEQWIPMGAGKILVGAKPSHESPKDAEYRSGAMRQQALPTNSWFSSLTYMQWSGVLHAHPLSFKATEQGFEMGLPEKAVEAHRSNQGVGLATASGSTTCERRTPARVRFEGASKKL